MATRQTPFPSLTCVMATRTLLANSGAEGDGVGGGGVGKDMAVSLHCLGIVEIFLLVLLI